MSDIRDVFTDVYNRNVWVSESRSGEGSSVSAAANIIREIPPLLNAIGAKSMLDVPCGDFMWMKEVDLGGVDYTGADIVGPMIDANNANFGREGRRFVQLNLLEDPLPQVDLILCRDCFIHLTIPMVFAALRNIAGSGAEWLLTSSYPWRAYPSNDEIDEVLLGGRRINLEIEPFHFSPPRRSIPEAEVLPFAADKTLCLWRIEDVRAALKLAPVMAKAKITGKSGVTRVAFKV